MTKLHNCELCKETDCILSYTYTTKDGVKVFSDLRLDLEANQIDMEIGTLDPDDYSWSGAIDINFCPVCGRKLE